MTYEEMEQENQRLKNELARIDKLYIEIKNKLKGTKCLDNIIYVRCEKANQLVIPLKHGQMIIEIRDYSDGIEVFTGSNNHLELSPMDTKRIKISLK